MSRYPHSLVVLCPPAMRDHLLALGSALGVTAGMSVLLYNQSDEETWDQVAMYGSHSWASPEFVALITRQTYPDPMPPGVTQAQIDGILNQCVVSVDANGLSGREHFDYVCGLHNVDMEPNESLRPVEEEEPI